MSGFLQGQSFRTEPVPNYQAAIYALSIRSPGFSALDYLTYTFPLSPELLRKEWMAFTAIYDTAGNAAQLGVNRDADVFGQSPPYFTIEGTTGWQRHQSDGYVYTGIQSMKALEQFIGTYQQLNQSLLSQQQQQLYTLEFYDYFRGDYWQVEPEGPQGVWQAKERPLYINYRFRFAAIQKVNAPILGVVDALLNVFGSPATATAVNVANGLANFINVYSDSGIV